MTLPLRGMRVLLVAEFYSSGGTRTYVESLLDFYSETGASVVLVPSSSEPDPAMEALVAARDFSYLHYADIIRDYGGTDASGVPVWSPIGVHRERRAFEKASSDLGCDLTLASAGTPGALLGAAHASHRGIYVLHTYPHGRRQRILGRWVMGRTAQSHLQLVAVSHYERRLIRQLWGKREVHVVPNSVGELSDATSHPEGPPLVFTASWVENYKDPYTWIRAAEYVRRERPRLGATFLWAGEGTQLVAARQAAERSSVSDAIRFIGHAHDVHGLYERASVYVQPSQVENMSLSVLDAQRMGVPSVVTDVGGLPEIITDRVTGRVVPPSQPQALGRAIVDLLDDPGQATAYARAGQEHYAVHFSPHVWREKMLALHLRK